MRGKSKKGALNQARILHSSYPLGPRWISLTYASGPATDFPLELEGLGLSQGLSCLCFLQHYSEVFGLNCVLRGGKGAW